MPEKPSGDNMSCPDYWVLKKTKKEVLDKIKDTKVRQLSKYYCENPEISTNIDLPTTITAANADSDRKLRSLKDVNAAYPTSIANEYHMKCNRLYPDYMASVDKRTFPINPTSMRCEYIKQCNTVPNTNISWTNVCNK